MLEDMMTTQRIRARLLLMAGRTPDIISMLRADKAQCRSPEMPNARRLMSASFIIAHCRLSIDAAFHAIMPQTFAG